MKKIERTNVVIVCLNQQAGFVPWQDPYTMKVDQGNRNCYSCRSFRHLARNCRNKGTGGRIRERRRLEYRNNRQRRIIEEENEQNNLNRDGDLIVLRS